MAENRAAPGRAARAGAHLAGFIVALPEPVHLAGFIAAPPELVHLAGFIAAPPELVHLAGFIARPCRPILHPESLQKQ